MHTRHTFGVADDELRGYMVTSPFVVPHFRVEKSPTIWANKCWFEVSRVQLWCIRLCVCNYSLECTASRSGVSHFVSATTVWKATFLPTGSRCLATTILGVFPTIVLPVPNPVCTIFFGKTDFSYMLSSAGQANSHVCIFIHSSCLDRS